MRRLLLAWLLAAFARLDTGIEPGQAWRCEIRRVSKVQVVREKSVREVEASLQLHRAQHARI